MREKATKLRPHSPDSRSSRSQARRANAERKLRVFNLLKAGVSVAEIALQEELSARRVREMIQGTLVRREIDPPAGFVQLQVGRLSDAMMVAHAAMMQGDLQALDRVVKIVGELDRYHGFGRAPGHANAAPALTASPPALALPAPAATTENRVAKD